MGRRFLLGASPHERPLLATMTHRTLARPWGVVAVQALQASWASGAAGCGYCRLYLDLYSGVLGGPPIYLLNFAGVDCKAEVVVARMGGNCSMASGD